MVAPTLYFVGGEDFDFASTGTVAVDTTSSHRRPSLSRCAVQAADGSSYWETGDVTDDAGVTDAWYHACVWMPSTPVVDVSAFNITHCPIRICDTSGVARLALAFTVNAGANTVPSAWKVYKIDAAGVFTQLGVAVLSGCFAGSPLVPDLLDIQVSSYGAAGTINIYINNSLVFTFTGDLTTDGNTTISGLRMSGIATSTVDDLVKVAMSYSEVIISDQDTRFLSLATLTPAADGNADTWTTGGVSNINETVLDDTTTNTSDTAGQIQQYTVTAPPVGSFGVVAVCVAARAQRGFVAGPTKLDLGTRTAGTDSWSADIDLPVSLQRVQSIFNTNPVTGDAFTIEELSDAAFNIGMKSVA